MMHCPALGVDLLPEEISAEVLKKIIKDVEEALGEPVTKAVVTVPAYFNDAQRDATSNAGYAAGLEKVKLLREPQAAALAYGVNRQQDSTVMVFGALTTRRSLSRAMLHLAVPDKRSYDRPRGGKAQPPSLSRRHLCLY